MTADAASRPTVFDVRELLAPLGGVLIAVAVVLAQLRMDEPWGDGVHLVVALVAAVALLLVGLAGAGPRAAARPAMGATMLLLAGLAITAVADARLLEVLGADEPFDGRFSLTAFFVILTLAAGAVTLRTGSAACLLVAALAAGGVLIAAVRWIFDTESESVFRVMFTVLALAYAAVAARSVPGRHRDVLVDASGAAILGLSFVGGGLLGAAFGGGDVPWPWEAVAVAGAVGLAAYSAVTRAPGPGVLAIVVLASFVTTAAIPTSAFDEGSAADATLVGWPLALVVVGVAAVAVALLQTRERS